MLRLVKLVLKFLSHRRLRSFLTTLGIAIGVALVVSLVSINQGMLVYVEDSFEQLGSDLVIVMPEFGPAAAGVSFDDGDRAVLERLYFVTDVQGMIFSQLPVRLRNEKITTFVMGLEEDFLELFGDMQSFEVVRGRELREGESHKALVGHLIAEDYHIGPGTLIDIEGREFRVVGVMSQVGNRQDDTQIYITMKDFQELTGREGEYTGFYLTVTEPKTEKLEEELEDYRGRKDFQVSTTEDLMETVNQILGVLTAVFVAVASISILVGAVGVANTMYMAVLERTKDIGIMKAVGANERQVLLIFLLESGFLSLIGGLAGMVFGFLLSKGLSFIAAQSGYTDLKPVVTPGLVAVTAALSFGMGVLSGVFPARQASKMQPVDALRYE